MNKKTFDLEKFINSRLNQIIMITITLIMIFVLLFLYDSMRILTSRILLISSVFLTTELIIMAVFSEKKNRTKYLFASALCVLIFLMILVKV